MKEVVLAVVIMGIVGMSVGFAQNTVSLNLQDLGVGEELLTSPVNDSHVTFKVEKVVVGFSATRPIFKNLVTKCLFKSDDSISGPATIICKLLDGRNGPNQFGKIIAEGKLFLPNGYTATTTIEIPITDTAFPFANEAVKIKGVKIVVQGPNPT